MSRFPIGLIGQSDQQQISDLELPDLGSESGVVVRRSKHAEIEARAQILPVSIAIRKDFHGHSCWANRHRAVQVEGSGLRARHADRGIGVSEKANGEDWTVRRQ